MHIVGRKIFIISGVLLLCALVGAATALTAEGCVWRDANNNGLKDTTEACEAGWMLHAKVTDNTGTVVQEGDFTTNTAGTSGKFSYTIPAAKAGTWSCIISEVPPNGFVVVVPSGSGKPVTYSYTKTYTSTQGTTPVAGYSFGNKQVAASAEGCFWTDLNGNGKYDPATEPCEGGRTLHAVIMDDSGAVVNQEEFQTNTLGTGGKFSHSLPVPPTGKTWTCTISEVAPDGLVTIVPVGGSYTKSYTAIGSKIGGYSFGNKQVAASAEGCFWTDLNADKTRDDNEPCEADRSLHATIADDIGGSVFDGDFQTNTLGTNGKFSYSLPVPPTGKAWTLTISELITPDGYVNVVPGGANPAYSKNYSAINPNIAGFSFGHQQSVSLSTVEEVI
jgi:hypothetical protein